MANDCLFCKIAKQEIPSPLTYEDELLVAFDDIAPQAPVHKLIIPKQHISTLNELTQEHNALIGHMLHTAKKLAAEHGIAEDGYRVLMNCNEAGGQTVFHIHMHMLGGRQMQWPPG